METLCAQIAHTLGQPNPFSLGGITARILEDVRLGKSAAVMSRSRAANNILNDLEVVWQNN